MKFQRNVGQLVTPFLLARISGLNAALRQILRRFPINTADLFAMKRILLTTVLLTAVTPLWSQTRNVLPGGIPRSAIRALPAPPDSVKPPHDSASKSNIVVTRATRERQIQPTLGGARADFGL